ncbi:hypothetical protein Scep_010654 [Stephania cephalantha]|uniref:Uncharacterized protein n=1 Tax=Stephania cephalantha TaxID=152367 RepID=A0AAP0JWS1_9MAGN
MALAAESDHIMERVGCQNSKVIELLNLASGNLQCISFPRLAIVSRQTEKSPQLFKG